VFDEARRWYRLLGSEDRIKWVVGPGGHGTPLIVREAIYEWMIRWLKGGEGDVREEPVQLVPDHDLQVTERGQVAGRELYQIINDAPRQQGSLEELQNFVKDLVAANAPLVRNVRVLPERPRETPGPAVLLVQ